MTGFYFCSSDGGHGHGQVSNVSAAPCACHHYLAYAGRVGRLHGLGVCCLGIYPLACPRCCQYGNHTLYIHVKRMCNDSYLSMSTILYIIVPNPIFAECSTVSVPCSCLMRSLSGSAVSPSFTSRQALSRATGSVLAMMP